MAWIVENFTEWTDPAAELPKGAVDVSIRRTVELEHTIVRWSEFGRGGHFAAMEAPDLLVGDVRKFFSKLR